MNRIYVFGPVLLRGLALAQKRNKSKDEAMGQSVSQSLVQSTLSDQPGTLSLHFQLFNVNYEDGVLIWN